MLKKIIYLVVALGLIAIVVIRLKSNKETTQERVYQYDKQQAVNVQAITLKPETLGNESSYTGSFEPNKESKISADIQGKIKAVWVDVGSIAQKGQALVQLDNSLLKLQLQSVEIQIEGLEADVKRFTILANADAIQGVQLEKAVLGLKSAKVQKATLEEQISKTTIVSPFNGIVTAKLSDEGAFAAPGIPLLQITDISLLKFTIMVPENELNRFGLNQTYPVSIDAFPETILSGKVSMTGSKSNMGNSFPVQFSTSNTPDLKIKSGMFGKVILTNESQENHLMIPASAIVGTTVQPQVYVVRNGKAILQNITLSGRFENKAVISKGLSQGDVLVTNGFVNLFDSANVHVTLNSEL